MAPCVRRILASAGTFFDTDTEIILGAGGGSLSYTTANSLSIFQTAGKITGTGSLTKVGVGVLAIASTAGNNTYSGGTFVNEGELRMRTVANTLPTSTAMTVTSPGIFNLNAVNTQIGSLTGNGSVGLAGATLTVNGTTSTTFSGVIAVTANAGAQRLDRTRRQSYEDRRQHAHAHRRKHLHRHHDDEQRGGADFHRRRRNHRLDRRAMLL